jgi:Family of unknown function (DUF5715)
MKQQHTINRIVQKTAETRNTLSAKTRKIVIGSGIALFSILAYKSCHTDKEWPAWKSSVSSATMSSNVIDHSDMNSQTYNTNPYFWTHKPKVYSTLYGVTNDKNMVPLIDEDNIHLDDDAGKSEMSADAFHRLSSPHQYVFLNTKAKDILLTIQKEFNDSLTEAGYLHGEAFFNITSASRTHTAQAALAQKDIEKTGKTNATDALSAHEVGVALDIEIGAYYRINSDGERVKITDKTTTKRMNYHLKKVLAKHQEHDIFITPESSWIIHVVCLTYGPNYNHDAPTIDHPPHTPRAIKAYEKKHPKK